MIAVATTATDLASSSAVAAAHGLEIVDVCSPSPSRRVLLLRPAAGASAASTVSALRAVGEMAVVRPDDGAALGAWRRNTAPVTIAQRVTVALAWSEHERATAPGLLELGPGGFGSGHHPTTRMMIEVMADRIAGGERVLDVGCGSGVLALAARSLGAAAAVGVDLKADAVAAAQRNATMNGVDAFESTTRPISEVRGTFDVVVANIARAGIADLAADMSAALRTGGWLAVSGITPAQCEPVAGLLRPLRELDRRIEGEWAAMVFGG